MRNKLDDATNHAFAALERLNDEDLTIEQLELEIKRAAAIAKLVQPIVKANAIKLAALKMVQDGRIDREDSKTILKLKDKVE